MAHINCASMANVSHTQKDEWVTWLNISATTLCKRIQKSSIQLIHDEAE